MLKQIVLLIMLFSRVAFGQVSNPSVASSTVQPAQGAHPDKEDPTKSWNRGHRSRFPNTEIDNSPDGSNLEGSNGGRIDKKSGLFKSLGDQFNPCDIDYGERLDAWRRQITDETIRNVFWYLTAFETLALLVICFYIAFLQRERKLRHIVVVDTVCQLYNSWAFSDNKARSVIAIHNQRMRELNDEYEVRLRGGESAEPAFEVSALQPVIAQSETSIALTHSFDDEDDEDKDISEDRPSGITKATIPSLAAENYGFGSKPFDPGAAAKQNVEEALAQVNKTAATAASESETQKKLVRTEARLRAVEEQNTALKRMVNEKRERHAVDEISPFDKEGL